MPRIIHKGRGHRAGEEWESNVMIPSQGREGRRRRAGSRPTTTSHDALRVPAEDAAWVCEAVCSDSWVWQEGRHTTTTTQ